MNIERKDRIIRFTDTAGMNYDLWEKITTRFVYIGYTDMTPDLTKEYCSRGIWLNEDQSMEILKILKMEHDNSLYSDALIEKDNKNAKDMFGITENFKLAGFILKDGDMLNFSHDGLVRDIDHTDISDVLETPRTMDSYYDGLIRFINYGNVRLQQAGFEISRPLTIPQKRVLSAFIRKNDGSVYVDISNKNGQLIHEINGFHSTPGSIFREIDDYFASIEI